LKSKLARNNITGIVLLVASVIVFVVYTYVLLGTKWGIIVLQLTVIGAVAALLAVLGWIGYTMATTKTSEDDMPD